MSNRVALIAIGAASALLGAVAQASPDQPPQSDPPEPQELIIYGPAKTAPYVAFRPTMRPTTPRLASAHAPEEDHPKQEDQPEQVASDTLAAEAAPTRRLTASPTPRFRNDANRPPTSTDDSTVMLPASIRTSSLQASPQTPPSREAVREIPTTLMSPPPPRSAEGVAEPRLFTAVAPTGPAAEDLLPRERTPYLQRWTGDPLLSEGETASPELPSLFFDPKETAQAAPRSPLKAFARAQPRTASQLPEALRQQPTPVKHAPSAPSPFSDQGRLSITAPASAPPADASGPRPDSAMSALVDNGRFVRPNEDTAAQPPQPQDPSAPATLRNTDRLETVDAPSSVSTTLADAPTPPVDPDRMTEIAAKGGPGADPEAPSTAAALDDGALELAAVAPTPPSAKTTLSFSPTAPAAGSTPDIGVPAPRAAVDAPQPARHPAALDVVAAVEPTPLPTAQKESSAADAEHRTRRAPAARPAPVQFTRLPSKIVAHPIKDAPPAKRWP